MNDEEVLLSYFLSPFIIHHCFTLPLMIRDEEKREAGKL
jgi:hypothetical protein